MPVASIKRNTPPGSTDDGIVLSSMDRRIDRRLITPARVAAAAGIALLVAVSAYAYLSYGMTRALTVGAERITVSRVEYGTFREYIPVTGNIVPRTTVYLDAVEGGQVTGVHVEAGAIVEVGDPLVGLKNTNLQLQVIGAEAQLTEQLNYLSSTQLQFQQNTLRYEREIIEIDYQIDRLTRELARLRPVLPTGGTTQGMIDDLEAELTYRKALREAVAEAQALDEQSQGAQIARLQAALDAMNRNLDIARDNLNSLIITAPISGQLTMLEANVGESKSPGQRIGQIDEQNAFKVSAFIDEFYLSRVALGQLASVDINGEAHELEVVKIYPDVNDRQFEVDLLFVGTPPERIRRGQTVRMRLEIGQPADTLVLANGAFYDDTGGQWVFALDESGDFAERRDVRFGRRNPEGIEVLEGLEEGDEVIVSGYENFIDFDQIRFTEETP